MYRTGPGTFDRSIMTYLTYWGPLLWNSEGLHKNMSAASINPSSCLDSRNLVVYFVRDFNCFHKYVICPFWNCLDPNPDGSLYLQRLNSISRAGGQWGPGAKCLGQCAMVPGPPESRSRSRPSLSPLWGGRGWVVGGYTPLNTGPVLPRPSTVTSSPLLAGQCPVGRGHVWAQGVKCCTEK